ncbi:MAG: phosphoglycerate kinase [Candidatus Thermoplasmatota archaeon]|nr:phosphoglycerate kinase [Candidatus Thermoplasmatota archaeon]
MAEDGDLSGSATVSGMGFHTLDDFKVRGRRVLLRIDVNSPVDEKTLRLVDGSKIVSSVPGLRELMDRGARVIIIAHQGRPGDYDFIPLNEHAQYLSKYIGKKVRYVNDLVGKHAIRAIDTLVEGEAVLLQNVREFPEEQLKKSPEEHAQSALVKALAPKFDLFVNDAFGSSHRSHASLVGFTTVLPSAAGRLMEKEVRTLTHVFTNPKRPSTFIFGGTKFADALQVIRTLAERESVDSILVAGLAGYAFLWATGKKVGSKTEELARRGVEDGVMENARKLIQKYGAKIHLPVDAAISVDGRRVEVTLEDMPEDGAVMDIGSKTAEEFRRIIMDSKTIFLSGPPGVFENPSFCKGTAELFDAMVESEAFCVIGGGHSSAAANRLGVQDKMSYISTGGGALERLVLGKPMPVVEALRASAKKL